MNTDGCWRSGGRSTASSRHPSCRSCQSTATTTRKCANCCCLRLCLRHSLRSFADFRSVYLAGCLDAELLTIVNDCIGFFSVSDPAGIPASRILTLLDYDEVC